MIFKVFGTHNPILMIKIDIKRYMFYNNLLWTVSSKIRLIFGKLCHAQKSKCRVFPLGTSILCRVSGGRVSNVELAGEICIKMILVSPGILKVCRVSELSS